jgi:hypothetical protein
MPITVNVFDETSAGHRVGPQELDFLTERVTARELLRDYVYQEVVEHNARQRSQTQPALVEPSALERLLNGARPAQPQLLDWQAQYTRALRAFERNGFLLLVDDRQILELDEEIELRAGAEVVFLKLVPLMGG